MQYDPFRLSRDLSLTWPEVKLWPWPFKVILYIVRRALTKQTRWCQIRCSTFKIKDFIVEKPFWKILEFWPLVTSILTWAIKWQKWFRNDFSRAFERCLVFLYGDQEPRSWGAFKRPPPPSRRWKIQRPSRARVNKINYVNLAAPRANQRRAAPPPLDADWIWPWTPADSSRLTAQWTGVVIDDWWMLCQHADVICHFFAYGPHNDDRALGMTLKWWQVIRRADTELDEHADPRFCSVHFKPSYFVTAPTKSRRNLIPEAIPPHHSTIHVFIRSTCCSCQLLFHGQAQVMPWCPAFVTCRRLVPPLKNPWRHPCLTATTTDSRDQLIFPGISDFSIIKTDVLEWV